MNKSTLSLLFVLIVFTVLFGYNYFFRPFAYLNQTAQVEEPVAEDVQLEDESPIEKLANQMSVREKVAQLMAAPLVISGDFEKNKPEAQLQWIGDNQPGVVTLFGSAIASDSAEQAIIVVKQSQFKNENELVPLVAVDHEGGTTQRLNGTGFTVLPSWKQLCGMEVVKSQMLLESSAQELSVIGIDIVLAPVVDYGANRVLGSRICSADRQEVISAAENFVQFFQKEGILPVLKHFPGIGKTNKDLHRQFDTTSITTEDAEIYVSLLSSFPKIGVMTTHVGVENQFPDLPCSLSSVCVGEVANNFPQVLIFSDALEMKAAAHTAEDQEKALGQVAVEAARAGNNVLIFGPSVDPIQLTEVLEALEKAYTDDPLIRTQIDVSLNKVLTYKLGLENVTTID